MKISDVSSHQALTYFIFSELASDFRQNKFTKFRHVIFHMKFYEFIVTNLRTKILKN
jgi:hypothetical protein